MNEFIHGWRISSVSLKRRRRDYIFSGMKQAVFIYEDTSDCRQSTTFAIILPGWVPGQKNPRRKTHEFEWVPNGQDSPPRGCNFLLVLDIARGDHPLGLIMSVECGVCTRVWWVGLRFWKNGYHNFLCIGMKVLDHHCANNWEILFLQNCWGQHHFAEPISHVLTFLHSILICRVTFWAPLELLFFNRGKSGTWPLKEHPH